MTKPEQPFVIIADNPVGTDLVNGNIFEGLSRRENIKRCLDVADDLERTSLLVREAARLITDGIIEVPEVIESPLSDQSDATSPSEEITTTNNTPNSRRIPIRIRAEKVTTPDLNDFVAPHSVVLEAEVAEAFSDAFLSSLVEKSKIIDEEQGPLLINIPTNEELQVEIAEAWHGVFTTKLEKQQNYENTEDFTVWENELDDPQGRDDSRHMASDQELANHPKLRRRAVFQTAQDEGKGRVGQITTFALDKTHVVRIKDAEILNEIDRSGGAVIEAKQRLAKGEDISDLMGIQAVRNLTRALRNPLSGITIPITDEAGHVTGGNFYPLDDETKEKK